MTDSLDPFRGDAVDFVDYSQRNIHFYSRHVPELLAQAMAAAGPGATLADIGCGDGHLVWALAQGGLLQGKRVYGVDLSPLRLQRFRALTGYEGLQAQPDGHTPLEGGALDLVLSTMVIEHVPDDQRHAHELARIVRPGGWIYLTTVIRKRGAWYFRKAPDGRRVLDPTHLREYPSVSHVTDLLVKAGFALRSQRLSRLFFPIAHPLVRLLHARRPIEDVQRFFLKPSTAWLERVALPIPRYRAIEILAERLPGNPR